MACKRIFLVNEHHAKRAGLHYDIRFGAYHPEYKQCVFFSWATRKWVEFLKEPCKILAFETEIHSWKYQYFEGEIEDGYGAGLNLIWIKSIYTLDDKKKQDRGEFYQQYLSGKITVYVDLKHYGKLKFTLLKLPSSRFPKNAWLMVRSYKDLVDEVLQ